MGYANFKTLFLVRFLLNLHLQDIFFCSFFVSWMEKHLKFNLEELVVD